MNKHHLFENIEYFKNENNDLSQNEIFDKLFISLSKLDNFLFASIFSLNPEFFIFELTRITNLSLSQIADENFDILLENGIISRSLDSGNLEQFPELKNTENTLNFIIIPILTNRNANNILLIALNDYWESDKEINLKFCELQIQLLANYLEIKYQNEKNIELNDTINNFKQNSINSVLINNEVVDTILNSIQSGVLIAKKDTKEIIKANTIASKIIAKPTQEISNNYLDEFLPLQNNLTNAHFESQIKDIFGKSIDVLRRNTIAMIDGIEYVVESFVEISEQKKIQNLLKDHNKDLEIMVNEKTQDLFNTIEKLENSIKQKREIEESAENEKRYSELKSKFLLMVGHEFRTPLTVIRNNVEILKNYSHKLSAVQLDHYTTRIISSIDYIATILLNINKYQEDIGVTKNTDDLLIPVIEVIESKINELKKTINKPVFIDLDIPKDLMLEYHIDTFYPLMHNLIDNIFVYSNEIVLAEITYKRQGNNHIYQFYDKGIGIPNSDLPRVTEVFYRGSNIVNRPGVGMGLAVVNKILQFINGFIFIESTENLETKVTIQIPVNHI